MRSRLLLASAAVVAGLAACELLLRRGYETWGSDDDVAGAALPGDEIISAPNRVSTRSVVISAEPSEVWPWLVQIGHGRGGLYSYDCVENLVGCQIVSADHIDAEYQSLETGDLVRMGPDRYPTFRVVEVEARHHLVLVSADPRTGASTITPDNEFGATWQWMLQSEDGVTRLTSRQRLAYPAAQLPMWWLVQPVAFVMERKMLLGIKHRAEDSATGGSGVELC